MTLPDIALAATSGPAVNLSKLKGRTVVYIYPRTGVPGVDAPPGWDDIPGARGCTPQSCGFRDHFAELKALGVAQVYGLSTQDTGLSARGRGTPASAVSNSVRRRSQAHARPRPADLFDLRHDAAQAHGARHRRRRRSSKRSIRCFRRTRTPRKSSPGCAAVDDAATRFAHRALCAPARSRRETFAA